jgi:hypothetical protein
VSVSPGATVWIVGVLPGDAGAALDGLATGVRDGVGVREAAAVADGDVAGERVTATVAVAVAVGSIVDGVGAAAERLTISAAA